MSSRIQSSLAKLRQVELEMHAIRHLTLPIDAVEKWSQKLHANLDILEREIQARLLEDIVDFDDDFGHSSDDLNHLF